MLRQTPDKGGGIWGEEGDIMFSQSFGQFKVQDDYLQKVLN